MKHTITFMKQWIIVTCCSFTVEILSFTLLGEDYVPALEATALQQTFMICIAAGFGALLVMYHDFQHPVFGFIAPLFVILTIVYVFGTLIFQLIPIDFGVYFVVFVLSLIIYAICTFLFYRKNQTDAEYINQQLQRRDHDHA